MRVYLDLCTLNRLMDNQSQPRVAAEARAVEEILIGIERALFTWISSVLVAEARRNRDDDRREAVLICFAAQ